MKKKIIRSKKSKWSNYSWGDKVFLIVVYTILTAITLVCLYPLFFTIIASISDPYEVYQGHVNLLPKGFTFESYQLVFQNDMIWEGYANSIFYTVLGTAFNLILTIPAAYALSKKRMLGRSFIMTVFLITMYFGGGMIPTYMLYNNMGLINTRWILVINGGVSIYNIIVTRTYFQNNVPESLYEAARIDGCSELGIFWKIAVPLSTPIIAVILLYYAVGHWNSYFSAMIYTTKNSLQPLQLVLRKILILNEKAYEEVLNSENASGEAIALAAKQAYLAVTMKFSLVFIGSAPMLILYPFIQKYFVKGIMIGSLKD